MMTRRLAGRALLALGLWLSVASYLILEHSQGEEMVGVHSIPAWYQFWVPHTYTLLEAPSYTVTYLAAGSSSLTAGCILVFGDPLFEEDEIGERA